MKKRDFIQQASIEFMPQTEWDMDKSIQYAEKLWLRLDQRGYGDNPPGKSHDIVNHYQQLPPIFAKQFDKFWKAFNYKHGKQRAAMRWQQLGEFTPDDLKKVIAAAHHTANARQQHGQEQTPVMAEKWLHERRFEDDQQSGNEKHQAKQNQNLLKQRELISALNHAKKMAASCSDDFWNTEVQRLTAQLKTQRDKQLPPTQPQKMESS